MLELIAYHATKRSKIDSILKNGFNPSISTDRKEHWLGDGVYFYEDLYYAVEWCYLGIKKKDVEYKELQSNFGIIVTKIDISNYKVLDLNSGLGYYAYQKIISKIKENCNSNELGKIENDGDIKTIRIIEKIEKQMGKKFFSSFDIVSALYFKNVFRKKRKYNGDFVVGVQKQICVKNPNAIVDFEEYDINDKKIKKLYNLIVKNRRKIK